MEIKWPEIFTNILGFLILYWGLRRFAWGPILRHLDERRQRIRKDIESAGAEKQKAEGLRVEYEQRLKEIDALGRKRIEEATSEALKVGAEMKEKARTESRAILDKARADIDRERATARVALRDDIVAMVVLGMEKILHERLTQAKQEELVGKFIDELEGINA
jgi:F-type H+-transporting ATPase subunit b